MAAGVYINWHLVCSKNKETIDGSGCELTRKYYAASSRDRLLGVSSARHVLRNKKN
jgi:invasion protein IalB